MLTGKKKEKKRKRERKRNPVKKNKNPVLLISCQPNQSIPILFPLKSPMCLLCWLVLEKLGLGFAYVRLISAAARREDPVYFIGNFG